MTRRERQEQTRAKLLKAAARVFARRGYEGATMPEIAAEAGLSTGAIYSNFGGKEDLFHALMASEMRGQQAERLARVDRAASLDEAVTAAAHVWADYVDERREEVLLLLEFCLVAARGTSARPLIAERLKAVRDNIVELMTRIADGEDVPVSPERLAAAIQALSYGFALQRLVDPDSVGREQFTDALAWLLDGIRS